MRQALFCLCASALLFAGCRSQNQSSVNVNASPETIVSSTPPFQTREPDRYQAARIVTIVNPAGGTVVAKTLIAKDGEMRRYESGKAALLEISEGRFILLPDGKVYAEFTSGESNADEGLDVSPERLLHSETGSTSYQSIGTEVIAGRNTNKYRVVVNDSSAENVSSTETLIWIDEKLKMPIRSETTANDGTRITTELSDIVLEVDRHLFQVPEGYEKIPVTELRRRLLETSVR